MADPNSDSSLSVKEWLSRIDGKLDTLNARMNAAELKAAMSEAHVDANERRLGVLEAQTDKLSSRFSSVLAGIGVGLFGGLVAFVRSLGGV